MAASDAFESSARSGEEDAVRVDDSVVHCILACNCKKEEESYEDDSPSTTTTSSST